jgi:hypothetical protein
MTCNGKALFVGSCLIRDPVTMIAALSSSAVSADVRGNESCANAGAVRQLANNNIAVFEIFIKSPSSVPARSRALIMLASYSGPSGNATAFKPKGQRNLMRLRLVQHFVYLAG